MNCTRKPFPWRRSSIAKSPFRTCKTAKKAERRFLSKKSIGFTATSSLKSMGRIPRSSGCYVVGNKYKTRKVRK